MTKLFGTDGIRGIANAYPMDGQTAMAVGSAVATFFRSTAPDRNVVPIGQDTRLSGDMIANAVSAGICSAGLNVSLLGVVPTPAVAFFARTLDDAAGGIVISASHNPYSDNGIKVFDSKGTKLSDADETLIEHQLAGGPGKHSEPEIPSSQIGRIQPLGNSVSDYTAFLRQSVPKLSLKGMKIILDCANGATFKAAPLLFSQLGADITAMFCEPNGTNINAACGSQFPEALAQAVVAGRATIGLAFDGDGDRLIAIDEAGAILTGDQIIAVCAKHLKDSGKLKKNLVVTTVMSNLGLHRALGELNIQLETSQVGDRHVMRMMHEHDAVLGGENSGHIIFRDEHTTGDGLMAALRLIDAMVCAQKPLSEMARIMDVFPQELINVEVLSKPDLQSVPQIIDAIRSVEKALSDEGRVLVRYSGTQSQCRVMVEGPTVDSTRKYCRQIADVVSIV
jgi:phosphoglucosamine mutase